MQTIMSIFSAMLSYGWYTDMCIDYKMKWLKTDPN